MRLSHFSKEVYLPIKCVSVIISLQFDLAIVSYSVSALSRCLLTVMVIAWQLPCLVTEVKHMLQIANTPYKLCLLCTSFMHSFSVKGKETFSKMR